MPTYSFTYLQKSLRLRAPSNIKGPTPVVARGCIHWQTRMILHKRILKDYSILYFQTYFMYIIFMSSLRLCPKDESVMYLEKDIGHNFWFFSTFYDVRNSYSPVMGLTWILCSVTQKVDLWNKTKTKPNFQRFTLFTIPHFY